MSDRCIVCQKFVTDGVLIDPEDYVLMCKECVRKAIGEPSPPNRHHHDHIQPRLDERVSSE